MYDIGDPVAAVVHFENSIEIARSIDDRNALTWAISMLYVIHPLRGKELLEQAHSIILMCLRTKEEGWLLRKRIAQPMYGKVGFVHAEPIANETVLETAAKTFTARTGLVADFEPAGSGYVKLLSGEALESFTHFTLFTANSYTGTLEKKLRNGENYWDKDPDFSDPLMIPSMPDLVNLLKKDEVFYVDLSYQV